MQNSENFFLQINFMMGFAMQHDLLQTKVERGNAEDLSLVCMKADMCAW
jgi:hypothetical protein